MFHVRRRPADYHPRKRKKKPTHKWNQQNSTSEMLEYRYEDGLDRLPFFLELNAGQYYIYYVYLVFLLKLNKN